MVDGNSIAAKVDISTRAVVVIIDLRGGMVRLSRATPFLEHRDWHEVRRMPPVYDGGRSC